MAKSNNERKAQKTEKTNRDKFVESAEIRVPKVLKQIGMIGNLSDKAKYEYTAEDVEKIHGAITEAADRMKARFESGEERESFTL